MRRPRAAARNVVVAASWLGDEVVGSAAEIADRVPGGVAIEVAVEGIAVRAFQTVDHAVLLAAAKIAVGVTRVGAVVHAVRRLAPDACGPAQRLTAVRDAFAI